MQAFVARQQELSKLFSAVDALASGSGFVSLLAGAQGLGKSMLLEQACTRAHERGMTVAWGRAWEVGGAPAYFAWSQVLAELAAWAGPQLQELIGSFAPYAARLCPEVEAAMPGLETVSELESSQTQFRMYDAMARFLRAAAQRAPMLLCFDDLHAADRNSLLMLQFAARSLRSARVGIIGSYRPEILSSVDSDVAAELLRFAREASTLSLGPLSRDEVAGMLTSALAREIPDNVVQGVALASEGSPLFVSEFARLLQEQKHLEGFVAAGQSLPIPTGILEVLRARQATLEPADRALLELGAVVGRDFELSLLAQSGETEAPRVLEALDRAIELGLIERLGPSSFRFSHVLIRESLYQSLSLSQRASLHLKVADVLEEQLGADSAALRFYHLREAAPLVESERLLRAALAAARESMRRLAFEEAAQRLKQALTLPSGPAQQALTRAELLVLLAGAEVRLNHTADALRAVDQAVEIARQNNDAQLFSRAALQFGAEFTPGFTNVQLVELLQEALGMLASGDSALRAKVMARLAAARQPSSVPKREVRAAHEAIAMARRVNDKAVLRDVIYMASSALASFEHPRVREPVDREMVEAARRAGDTVQEARGLLRLSDDAFELGRMNEAQTLALDYSELTSELGLPRYTWQAALLRAAFAALRGDFEEADDQVERAITASAGDRDASVEASITWFRISRLSLQGRSIDADELQDEIQRRFGRSPLVDLFRDLSLGVIHARAGNSEGARSALARLPKGSCAETDESIMMSWLAESVYVAGDKKRAERIWPSLLPYADCWVSGGIAMVFREGPVARPLGLLAATLGRVAEATEYLERAITDLRRASAWPLLARTECELAEILLTPTKPVHAQRAHELLREAAALIERYDLGQLRERVARAAPQRVLKVNAPARPDSSRSDYDASLAELAAGIAHEINNPLGALQSHADLARQAVSMIQQALEHPEHRDGTDQRKKLLRAVKALSEMQSVTPEATQRIERVVRELQSFARLDRAQIGEVDLEESLDSALALLAHRSVGRIAVERAYCGASRVLCQAQPINDALMSVLATAMDSIEDQGTIWVVTRALQSSVAIEIQDNGNGFTPDSIHRLFDPTLERGGTRVGMSLKLPIARRVIEGHGGNISVEARPGGGSAFRVVLPRRASLGPAAH